MRPVASVNLFLKTRRVLIVTLASYLMTIQGVRRELNPQKINLNEFIDAMQTCGMQLGFDRDFALHLYGSKEDFNRTLCLSFCALRRLQLYSIEDEIRKELSSFGSGNDTRLIDHVNKALKSCKNLLDDPCRLFDCLFDYAGKIDNHEESALLAKFFSD